MTKLACFTIWHSPKTNQSSFVPPRVIEWCDNRASVFFVSLFEVTADEYTRRRLMAQKVHIYTIYMWLSGLTCLQRNIFFIPRNSPPDKSKISYRPTFEQQTQTQKFNGQVIGKSISKNRMMALFPIHDTLLPKSYLCHYQERQQTLAKNDLMVDDYLY